MVEKSTKEKKLARRKYMKGYMRKRRLKQKLEKQKRLEQYLKAHPYDFITGMPQYKKDKFPSYRECKQLNPDLTFKEWFATKKQHELETRNDGKPLQMPIGTSKSERDYAEGIKRHRKHDLIGFKDKK